MKITITKLRELDACKQGLKAFREAFPRGLTPAKTPRGRAAQASRAAEAGLDVEWAAWAFLSDPAYAAYKAATGEYADRAARAFAFLEAVAS